MPPLYAKSDECSNKSDKNRRIEMGIHFYNLMQLNARAPALVDFFTLWVLFRRPVDLTRDLEQTFIPLRPFHPPPSSLSTFRLACYRTTRTSPRTLQPGSFRITNFHAPAFSPFISILQPLPLLFFPPFHFWNLYDSISDEAVIEQRIPNLASRVLNDPVGRSEFPRL